ncbi:hypothetical protein STRTUCAR8_09384, partial [Streptomyces turgidiscabies Car8]
RDEGSRPLRHVRNSPVSKAFCRRIVPDSPYFDGSRQQHFVTLENSLERSGYIS